MSRVRARIGGHPWVRGEKEKQPIVKSEAGWVRRASVLDGGPAQNVRDRVRWQMLPSSNTRYQGLCSEEGSLTWGVC